MHQRQIEVHFVVNTIRYVTKHHKILDIRSTVFKTLRRNSVTDVIRDTTTLNNHLIPLTTPSTCLYLPSLLGAQLACWPIGYGEEDITTYLSY